MIADATATCTCDKLVEIKTSVDNYRRPGIKRLQDKEADLVKWIGITLYNTFYPSAMKTCRQSLRPLSFKRNICEIRCR